MLPFCSQMNGSRRNLISKKSLERGASPHFVGGLLAIFLFGISFPLSSLLSYQPGRWSHTDPYVLGSVRGGPARIRVEDASGRVVKSARYRYDGSGRLLEEVYYDLKNRKEGTTRFQYEKGRVKNETLYDKQGRILTRIVYAYSGKNLHSTTVEDGSGRVMIRQEYASQDGHIVGGVEIDGNNKDKFIFEYTAGHLGMVRFLNPDGTALSEVFYRYDKKGLLRERERIANGNRSLCRYEYTPAGHIESYAYFNLVGEDWVKEKKIILEYD